MSSIELGAPARAAAFVALLVVVLVIAFGVGRLLGPVDAEAPAPSHSDGPAEH